MRKEDSIQTIKGIGEKTAESFARLGIFTIDDLLHTYPRNYLSYEEPVCIRDAAVGERHAIRAMITSYVTVKQVRSLKLTILTVSDGDMTMHMTWFNQPFLRNVFHKGDSYIFVGTAKVKMACVSWSRQSIINFRCMPGCSRKCSRFIRLRADFRTRHSRKPSWQHGS